jgi:serine/threonine protein kinase
MGNKRPSFTCKGIDYSGLLRRERVGIGADIWSFGALFYGMATGKLQFHGNTVYAMVSAIMTTDSTPLSKKISLGTARATKRCSKRSSACRITGCQT